MRRWPTAPLLAVALAATLGACAADDATPIPSAGAPVAPAVIPGPADASGAATPSPAGSSGASPTLRPQTPPSSASPVAIPFALRASAFQPGGAIPSRFTCDGRDVSPALGWTGVPAGTASLVLLVEDPDAKDFAHWIAHAIPPGTSLLAEGAGAASSARLPQGTNDFGRVGYGGPCPPSGTHHYRFTLYALGAPLGLNGNPRATAVRAALAGATVLGQATLTATYAR